MTKLSRFDFKLISKATPFVIGLIAFFVVVGESVLNTSNIGWLESGDPAQHYLGWLFFRNSDWSFPLGLNPAFGLEISNAIIYSDSNPLMAILFKMLSPSLPSVFQYFGIWLLICFLLQSYFAYKIVSIISESWVVRFSGTVLFVFSPPMMARLFGHLSLVGHFFILAAIFLALKKQIKMRPLIWAMLLTLSAMVHAYLFIMCFAVWLADLIDSYRNEVFFTKVAFKELLFVMLSITLACWQVGYFSIHDGAAAAGYGYYRMNLLSLIDSNGWSYIIPDFSSSPGEGEGFSYLGLGSLFVFLLFMLSLISGEQRQRVFNVISRHKALISVALLLSLYAITHLIAFGSFEVSIKVPDIFVRLANVFRASGRLFWVVYYLIITCSIWGVVRFFRYRASIVLLIAAIAQIIDTRAMYQHSIHDKFSSESSSAWSSKLISPFWASVAEKYHKIRWVKPDYVGPHWQELSAYAALHHLSTDAVYLARVSHSAWGKLNDMSLEAIRYGRYQSDSLYVLDDHSFQLAAMSIDPNRDLLARVDGFNIIAPNWKNCVACFNVDELMYEDIYENVPLGQELSFAAGGDGVPYLLNGWSMPESWGIWSDGVKASLAIPYLNPNFHSLKIDVSPFIQAGHNKQLIEVYLNSEYYKSLSFDSIGDHSIVIDVAKEMLIGKHVLYIDLKFYSAVSPKEINLSNDSRLLSLGLKSMQIN